MILPPRLEPGDAVGIVSPSWGGAGMFPHRTERGVQHLQSLGFEVKMARNALNQRGFVSDTSHNRVQDIHSMFADSEVKAIVAAIGGNHSCHLLPLLDFDLIRKNPKVFMGFSDITVLNVAIWKETGLVTFNGPALLTDFAEYPRVLEVRDASWSSPEALEFIGELGLNVACLDMPMARQSFNAKALVTGEIGYLRMHGRNRDAWFDRDAGRDEKYNYLYADKELEQTLERVEQMRRAAHQVFVVWNNHFRGKAVVNALQSLHRLLGRKVEVPPPLRESYPHLERISRSRDGSLFEH